ncbi:hypothetical protein SISSUDRAFT_643610 [Sistotremastrum suecicum HHB10207 ss-3]|uniref:Uncharacterized protein n=1 Tax=Sistotremastrum suecicum HHB10207 ss-3 TaxID=1314776 RepID=A0A165X6L0_9AGAM|nr:hypothetical protein SISSUDRAFT_643610 [Sistotremastrum suecicum HHB10207 ss-3]
MSTGHFHGKFKLERWYRKQVRSSDIIPFCVSVVGKSAFAQPSSLPEFLCGDSKPNFRCIVPLLLLLFLVPSPHLVHPVMAARSSRRLWFFGTELTAHPTLSRGAPSAS